MLMVTIAYHGGALATLLSGIASESEKNGKEEMLLYTNDDL